jgi:hypothetical protein
MHEPRDYFFTMPTDTAIDESNFYKRDWLPILKAKKIRLWPFCNTRHSYVRLLFDWSRVRDSYPAKRETASRRWKPTTPSTSKRAI